MHGIEYRDDEIFYFQSTQEMIWTGDYLSPTYFGENRFQKPILYYWLVVLAYRILGTDWFAARFVAVVFAGLSVGCTWLLCKKFFVRQVADLSAIILMTVPLFFRHAKSAVPDMALNFFTVAAIYCGVHILQTDAQKSVAQREENPDRSPYAALFFMACAIGFMVKGFTAVVIPFITIILYSLAVGNTKMLADFRWGRGILIMALVICPWFLYMVSQHGQGYLTYMLVTETKGRLMANHNGGILLKLAVTFKDHCWFYLKVMGSYFAPWSIFLVGAVPLAIKKIKSRDPSSDGLRLMLIWFFVVFCFFAVMYFAINHYMLVLTTPFAVLTSCLLVEQFNPRKRIERALAVFRKYFLIFTFTLGSFAFIFLFVFLAGAAKGWLWVLLLGYAAIVRAMLRSPHPGGIAMTFGLSLLFVFAQSSLLAKAGLTPHSALQKFADTINQDISKRHAKDAVIGVGSHDIHEKEFQVYFDRQVQKAAGSMAQETRMKLMELFSSHKTIYCLITADDFDQLLKKESFEPFDVIQEDYIFRKRLSIDRGFFWAILAMDQETVRRYLKEKLVLIRKVSNA